MNNCLICFGIFFVCLFYQLRNETVSIKLSFTRSCPDRSRLVQNFGLARQTYCIPRGSHKTSKAGYPKQNFALELCLSDARLNP